MNPPRPRNFKTNPDHKASFTYGVHANCSCGWSGADWYGPGSKISASKEWWAHREKCELEQAEREA